MTETANEAKQALIEKWTNLERSVHELLDLNARQRQSMTELLVHCALGKQGIDPKEIVSIGFSLEQPMLREAKLIGNEPWEHFFYRDDPICYACATGKHDGCYRKTLPSNDALCVCAECYDPAPGRLTRRSFRPVYTSEEVYNRVTLKSGEKMYLRPPVLRSKKPKEHQCENGN